MNIKEMICEYIRATEENDERSEKIAAGLNLLCEGSTESVVEPLTYRLYRFYDRLMVQLVGEEAFEYISWYLYDSRLVDGTYDRKVVVDDIEYTLESPEDLYDVCIAPLYTTE